VSSYYLKLERKIVEFKARNYIGFCHYDDWYIVGVIPAEAL
jgi:hypothetical protein